MENEAKTYDDGRYLVIGNSKILITEYFREDGKPLYSILERVILDAGKMPEDRMDTAKTE